MSFRPRHLVNGAPGDYVSVLDRGLRYGDGCFETMLVRQGRLPLWRRHYARLETSLARLQIDPGISRQHLEAELVQLIDTTPSAILRLTITRGASDDGYRPGDHPKPNRIFSLLPEKPRPNHWNVDGVRVHLCRTRLAHNPVLAGIKHLGRTEQVMARMEWRDEYAEGLLCDHDGNVIEGTITNLFIIENDTVFTPSLENCGVAGVMRAEIMDRLKAQGIECIETGIPVERLLTAQACFLTNAVIGIWPVAAIGDRAYTINHIIRELATGLNDLTGEITK